MPFAHKLSRRLALLRDLAVLSVFVVLGCEWSGAGTGLADSTATDLSRVMSVAVAPPAANVHVARTVMVIATPLGNQNRPLPTRPVTWTSSDSMVARVVSTSNDTGIVTAVGPGSVNIVASSQGQTGTTEVTVTMVPVASVTLSPASASVTVGQTVSLTATPLDSSGNVLTGRTVVWASSAPNVANVNNTTVSGTGASVGAVVGEAAGSAVITASTGGQSATASLAVALVPVASMMMSPATVTVTVGQAASLTATPQDASGNPLSGRAITWATSNAAVATVSTSGVVTGVGAGSATVTASSGGQSATAAVTVAVVPIASVVVTPATANATIGQTTTLTATPEDASGNPLSGRVVTWTTSNAVVATVSASGIVTGVAAGSATITASSGGQNGTATITVTAVPVASVVVSPATASVTVGQTAPLAATPEDASGNPLSGRTVTWATSNAAVATVSATGIVTAVAVGSATITASSGGQNGTATITVTAVPVASVVVSPATASVTAGQTVTLTATPEDASGNPLAGRVVAWTTSNSGVATVSTSGVVTGVAAGSATITASSGGQNGTATITVTAVPVASVVVSPVTASVTVGQTTPLAATPEDASGNPLSGRTVTWATSNAAVATVSATGIVTAVAVGSATITASSGGQNGTATITVTAVPVASVVVSPATASVTVGQTVTLTATPEDASGNPLAGRVVAWTTSNSGVATVSTSGIVTGVAAGSATITASSGGQNGTATITVTAVPVASVVVSPVTASVTVGQTTPLAATPEDASGNPLSGRTVTWATSNAAVATVSATGVVTGVGAGSATITASSGGQSGTAALTVTLVPVASVAITPATASVTAGQTVTLTATPEDASGNPLAGRAVAWATSNSGVATVSASGVVTGVAAGSATITASSGGQNGTATVTVTAVPVASVVVSPATVSVTVGKTATLTATPEDASGNPLTGRTVTWATSNAAVATVSASGVVTGVATGSATITASSGGQSGTAAVTVTAVPVASVVVSPSTASVTVGATATLTATPEDASGNPLTGRTVTWGTSNAAAATVSANGVVTGVAAGSATITASSGGQSGTAAVTVAQAPVASVTVSPAPTSVQAGQTVQLVATPKDANGNLVSGQTIAWSTSNAGIATVSAVGLATGVAAGAATVTATSSGVSGTSAVTVTAAGTFATPTILTSVSFEDGWDGFVNFSAGTPGPSTPDSYGYSINRSQDYAYQGTWSVKSTYGPNPSDDHVAFCYDFTSQQSLIIFARWYFYIPVGGALPNDHHKWGRFKTAGFGGTWGGTYLASNINNGGITWDDADALNVDNDIGTGTVTKGVWHSIEVEYDRSGWNTPTGARARFWYDGNPVVGSNLGAPNYTGSANAGFWGNDAGTPSGSGPWLYVGQASAAAEPSAILDFDDTINGGNTATGAIYYDQIAVSTQRIGP